MRALNWFKMAGVGVLLLGAGACGGDGTDGGQESDAAPAVTQPGDQVGGTSAGGSGGEKSRADGPCRYLTESEAKQLLGVPTADLTDETGCTFHLDKTSYMTVWTQFMSKSSFESGAGDRAVQLQGLGDAAYFAVGSTAANYEGQAGVYVLQGGKELSVTLATTADKGRPAVSGDVQKKLTEIAKMAISRAALD